MKKILSVILILALSVFVFSCTKGEAGEDGPAGADGTGGLIMIFQNGTYPTASYQGTVDARLWSGSPTTNYGPSGQNEIGIYDASSIKRLAIQFNVGLLPSNAIIQAAFVTIYTTGIFLGAPQFAFYPLTQSFNEGQVTWNNRLTGTPWTDAGGTHSSGAVSSVVTVTDDLYVYTWELNASTVQSWVDTPAQNYGLLLKSQETGQNQVEMALTEYGTLALRPKLTVIYTLP